MSESIRSPGDPLTGANSAPQVSQAGDDAGTGAQSPQTPGPATGIVLDLLFCLPAILVLKRRALDPDYRLLASASFVPMTLLGLLAMASPLWAADKFAAAVSAMHLLCALVFLWSSCQLIRSWLRLRVVGGLCVGLAVSLAFVGYSFHLLDMTDLRQMWDKRKADVLMEHGWAADSFQAEMFEKRVLNGQPMGFSTSTNTYAGLLVLLGIVAAGVAIQRIADKDRWGWSIVPMAAAASLPILIRWTACRAAYATPIIAACILIGVWLLRRKNLASSFRFWRRAYFSVVAIIAVGTALLIHHGMRYGTLWHDSLSFRWRYWIGAFRILADGLRHSPRQWSGLFLGVGWENFGPHYLVHRLAIAPEEIRDPHNFIVRCFVELGIVGGVLLLAWILRLWWELTRPTAPTLPAESADDRSRAPLLTNPYGSTAAAITIVAIALLAVSINALASIDFGAQSAYITLEFFRRALFLLLLIVGLIAGCIRVHPNTAGTTDQRGKDPKNRLQNPLIHIELDERAAPWLLYSILAGLATFLIHNLIEFALFEPGPLFLFALLAGSALGIRSNGQRQLAGAAGNGAVRKVPAMGGAILAGVAWVLAAVLLAVPIIRAESLAHDADDDIALSFKSRDLPQLRRASQEALGKAATEMSAAFAVVPYNADYGRRATELLIASGLDKRHPGEARRMLDDAMLADPISVQNFAMRAQLEFLAGDAVQTEYAIHDFYRALELDPNNVRLRLDFARRLLSIAQKQHRPPLAADAAFEFDRALDFDAQLPPEEIKRLTPKELAEVQSDRKKAGEMR